jgi:hypothetical protein
MKTKQEHATHLEKKECKRKAKTLIEDIPLHILLGDRNGGNLKYGIL